MYFLSVRIDSRQGIIVVWVRTLVYFLALKDIKNNEEKYSDKGHWIKKYLKKDEWNEII